MYRSTAVIDVTDRDVRKDRQHVVAEYVHRAVTSECNIQENTGAAIFSYRPIQ